MFLLPYGVDVPMTRWPVANFVLLGVILVVSLAMFADPFEMTPYVVLDFPGTKSGIQWMRNVPPSGAVAWIGHMFAHAGFWHMAGNMIFLWTFGNAVCAKIGNGPYVALYLGGGLVAALAQHFLDGAPTIGASGAINAVVGAYLLLYPLNHVKCASVVFVRLFRFRVAGWILIVLWFVMDIWGAVRGGGGTAYLAHIGGLLAGALALAWALKRGRVVMDAGELSLLQALKWMPAPERWRGRPMRGIPRGAAAPSSVPASAPPPRPAPRRGSVFNPRPPDAG